MSNLMGIGLTVPWSAGMPPNWQGAKLLRNVQLGKHSKIADFAAFPAGAPVTRAANMAYESIDATRRWEEDVYPAGAVLTTLEPLAIGAARAVFAETSCGEMRSVPADDGTELLDYSSGLFGAAANTGIAPALASSLVFDGAGEMLATSMVFPDGVEDVGAAQTDGPGIEMGAWTTVVWRWLIVRASADVWLVNHAVSTDGVSWIGLAEKTLDWEPLVFATGTACGLAFEPDIGPQAESTVRSRWLRVFGDFVDVQELVNYFDAGSTGLITGNVGYTR